MDATMSGRGERTGSAEQCPANFAALLKLSRVDAQLAQEELAARAGLSVRSVRDIERGRVRYPRPETARLLGVALGLSGVELAEFVRFAREDYWTGRGQPPCGDIESASRSTGAGAPSVAFAFGDPTRTSTLCPTPAAQLPADLPVFTGRRRESWTLDGLLDLGQARLAAVAIQVLSGMAGVGKTALAVHWAHSVAARFPDGQLYTNLRGFDPCGELVTPAEAIRGFLHALGVPPDRIPPSLDAQAALYRSVLAGKRVLVLLDNARDAEQVRPLLPGTPTALTLVTSRNQLTPLVAAHGAQHLTLDLLTHDEARELLAQRLGTGRIAAEPRPVQQIITACAKLPLALAIAAARAQQTSFTLAALAAELTEAETRLDTLDTGDPSSQVRTVFSWSYTTLTPSAARVFRLIGLHPGPDISAPAAASLAGHPLPQASRLLTELARANLLIEHVPGRYTLHDLLRAYAAELAHTEVTETQRHAARHRMLDHYLHTAYTAALLLQPYRDPITVASAQAGVTPEALGDAGQATAWFAAEHPVLLGAARLAADGGFDTHTWHLGWTLADYFDRRGYWHDWATTMQHALEATRRLADPRGEGYSHRAIGRACSQLGRFPDAHTHFQAALDLSSQVGDRNGQAHAHLNLANLFEQQNQPDRALHHAQRALDLYSAAGHRTGQARALNSLGWLHAQLHNHKTALSYCQQALTLLRGIGDRRGEAETWDSLAYAYHHLGRHRQAITCYQHAIQLFQEAGDRYYEADTLRHLGDTHLATGNLDDARQTWQHALEILDPLHHHDADQVRTRLTDIDVHG
jgi:tetratricopeptide (TPR) repeat protein/DNA-binding XRE family transcriptional regulator